MKKKLTTTEKLRKNPYIVSTLALFLFCIVIVIGNIIEAKSINQTENEILCSIIYKTPAWVVNGKLISYGAMLPKNQSINLVNQVLIPENIKMLYNLDCSICQNQIAYFENQSKGSWKQYKDSGLAINCNEYKNE